MAVGDRVKVIADKEYVGRLTPSPNLLHRDTVVLKLDSGYNIGISKKNVKRIEVLEKNVTKKHKAKKAKFNPKLPTVALLSFGGTIASKVDYKTGGVYAEYGAADYLEMLPELSSIANIKTVSVMNKMSEDFDFGDWVTMSEALVKTLNDSKIDGIVCTQGTDTLHYTTAAMSFMLSGISKPVIFTAAQKSIDRGSTDAFMNLKCAIIAAVNFDFSGIATCMHGSSSDDYCLLIRGTKVRKMHTSRRDAFRPINELPLATVTPEGDIEILNKNFSSRSKGKASADNRFETKVGFVYAHPGIGPGVFDYYISKKYKGLIVSATALGHVPHKIVSAIKKCVDAGIYVGICSQTLYGSVHEHAYTNLRKISIGTGAVFLNDMMPDVGFVKLSLMLGRGSVDKMRENIAGEFNPSIDPGSFLF